MSQEKGKAGARPAGAKGATDENSFSLPDYFVKLGFADKHILLILSQ